MTCRTCDPLMITSSSFSHPNTASSKDNSYSLSQMLAPFIGPLLLLFCFFHHQKCLQRYLQRCLRNPATIKIKAAISAGSACSTFKCCMTKLIILTSSFPGHLSIAYASEASLNFFSCLCISRIHIRMILFGNFTVCTFSKSLHRHLC